MAVGPDPTLLPNAMQQAEGFIGDLSAQLAPEAAELLTTLSPTQADEFLANLDKRNLEELDEERERASADRQKRRTRSMMKTLERWTGTVTAEQKTIVERTVGELEAAGLLGETDEWYASQVAWRSALRQSLAKGAAGRSFLA